MAIDPDLLAILSDSTIDGDHSFIDLDTIRDNTTGKTYRAAGFDAPEITKILGTNEDGTPNIKYGTAGGAGSIDLMKLAKEQGFTNLVKEEDGAAHGRGLVRFKNSKGEDFATRLLEAGATGLTPHSTKQDEEAVEVARLFGDKIVKEGDDKFRAAGEDLMASMLEDGYSKTNFKRAATNEAEYASDPDSFSSNVQFRHNDRDMRNNSTRPWSTAWTTALTGVVEGSYGIVDLLGDSLDSETLSQIGEQGSARARGRIAEKGKILTDYKDVKGFGDAVDFVTNNLVMSLPYMAITAASAAAAAPTGGASLVIPATLYTGQIYNEQEKDKKHAGYAIAGGIVQGALDLVGLKLATRSIGKTPKEFFEAGVAKLMNAEGLTKELAEQKLASLTRRQIAGLAKDGAALAANQLTKKKLAKDILSASLTSGASEGVTEGLQEAIGYTASHYDGETFDWDELTERMIAGAVAGSALGSSMGSSGAIYDKGQWADVAFRLAPADIKKKSQAAKLHAEEAQFYGGEEFVPSTLDIAEHARRHSDPKAQMETLKDRAENHKKRWGEKTIFDQALTAATSVGKLFKGHITNAIPYELQEKSRALRKLGGMFGAGLQKVYSGPIAENFRHGLATRYSNHLPQADKFYKLFGSYTEAFGGDHDAISKQLYKDIEAATVDGVFDPDLVPDTHVNKHALVSLVSDLRKMGKEMHTDQSKYKTDLGYVDDYLLKRKSVNKEAIYNNRPAFIEALMGIEGVNIDMAIANELTDAIMGRSEVNTLDEAFDVVKHGSSPGSHKSRTLNLSERESFQEFMSQDILKNANDAALSAARFQTSEQFFGKDGSIVNHLLDEAIREGIPQEQVDRIAHEMYNYIEAESGNYKRATTEDGKKVQEIQKNFIFLTTISSLAAATLSSLPEIVITGLGVPRDIIFSKNPDSLKSQGEALAKDLAKIIKEEPETIDQYQAAKLHGSYGHNVAGSVGMFAKSVSTAQKIGVTEVMPMKQQALETYFKYNQLTRYTDFTRAVRASFASDFILNHLQTIINHKGPMTNEIQESREQLRNLGINISKENLAEIKTYLEADPNSMSEDMHMEMMERLRDPIYNFINDAIANPGTGNRPLFYQDPRFALFTQFQGFMSMFTAHHIPKMWGDYVKRGSPSMKFNAFAVMSGMIMMGFASQYLKDLMKYGESSPHLTTAETVRRGVFSSGLAGTYERIISTALPIYDTRSDNELEWAYNEIAGQSPAISKTGAALGLGKDIITGDLGSAAKDAARLVSVPTGGISSLYDAATNWDFKGD